MQKYKFSTLQNILILLGASAISFTRNIPSGLFDQLAYDKSDSQFIKSSEDGEIIFNPRKIL